MVKKLLEHVIKALAEQPAQVSITEIERENSYVVEVRVASQDLARVIGSEGRTFRALRTLVELFGPQTSKDLVVDVQKHAP